jgi:hypothetical protein
MSDVKVTICPPGVARGAGDLQHWAHNRLLGRSGVKDDKPEPKKDKADNWIAQKERSLAQQRKASIQGRKKQKRIKAAERWAQWKARKAGQVVWGDSWADVERQSNRSEGDRGLED